MGKDVQIVLLFIIFASLIGSLALVVQKSVLESQADYPAEGTVVIPNFTKNQDKDAKGSIQLDTFSFVTAVPTIVMNNVEQTRASVTGAKGRCGYVVDWAQKISDKLKVGGGGPKSGDGYDNLTQPITSACGRTTPKSQWLGQYWCTWIIMDAYRLAGMPIAKNPSVVAMHKWWKKAGAFRYVDYSGSKQNLQQVKPGYAIFLESVPGKHTGHEHVALVKKITLDARGNGTIISLESNASRKSKTYPVSNWKIRNTSYPARGFGGK